MYIAVLLFAPALLSLLMTNYIHKKLCSTHSLAPTDFSDCTQKELFSLRLLLNKQCRKIFALCTIFTYSTRLKLELNENYCSVALSPGARMLLIGKQKNKKEKT
jgi:hypothetical protein